MEVRITKSRLKQLINMMNQFNETGTVSFRLSTTLSWKEVDTEQVIFDMTLESNSNWHTDTKVFSSPWPYYRYLNLSALKEDKFSFTKGAKELIKDYHGIITIFLLSKEEVIRELTRKLLEESKQ